MCSSNESILDETTNANVPNEDEAQLSPPFEPFRHARSSNFKSRKGAPVMLMALCAIFTLLGVPHLSKVEYLRRRFLAADTIAANTIQICVNETILISKERSVGANVVCYDSYPDVEEEMIRGETDESGCIIQEYVAKSWHTLFWDRNPDIYCVVTKDLFVTAATEIKFDYDQSVFLDFGTITLYRDRNFDYGKTNGCGNELMNSFGLNGLATELTGFEEQCTNHDKCYTDCNIYKAFLDTLNATDPEVAGALAATKGQALCDDEMKAGMDTQCALDSANIPGGYHYCKWTSNVIRDQLEIFGDGSYGRTNETCGEDDPSIQQNKYPFPLV